MPDNHLKSWTAEEVSELRRLAAEGASVDRIAAALGRTRDAVSTRLKERRVFPRPISLKPW
jgi:hypothetical protein